jgi:hypothetical protein
MGSSFLYEREEEEEEEEEAARRRRRMLTMTIMMEMTPMTMLVLLFTPVATPGLTPLSGGRCWTTKRVGLET